MYAGCMASYGLSRKVCTFALLLRSVGVSDRIPKSACDEYPTFTGLFREQHHRVALAIRPGICHHARPRAPTHTRAPGSPPLTESGGRRPGGARVVWVVEYMCIYEPGHIRCRCRFRTRCRFRPDPSLRFAALRGRVFEPRSDSCRRQRLGGSPLRCPREGRCGAGAPVARGSSQVLGSPAERLSSGRRVEARSASLRSVNTPAPQASRRPRAPTSIQSEQPPSRDLNAVPPHLRAGERAAHAHQRPCKRFWRTFTPSPHSREGTALKGAKNGLHGF